MRALALLPLGFLVLLLPAPAVSQYMFLDTNGDGVHDESDRLSASGKTTIDVWLVTDRNRDGTPVSCDVAEAGNGLTINSYTIVLHAAGGDVKWGPMQNRLPFSGSPVCFAAYEDTIQTDWYHNGWGWLDQFPPGKHLVATLPIEVISGRPSIFLEPYLPRRVVQITSFGTSCMARDGDNTYKLGLDWFDADGLGRLRADAGGPYEVQAGRALQVDGTGSRVVNGNPLTYAWDFGDGGTGQGALATHTYASAGDYPVILGVQGGDESDADTTNVHVVPPQAPFARIISAPVGYVGVPMPFDASTSYDPDGDRLEYAWTFGDGTNRAVGVRVEHTYGAAGARTVTLIVDDGLLTDTATREVSVYAVPHPPVARAGGPYSGIVGRLISFNGTASSDADGDPLVFAWGFGDRMAGTGPISAHAYTAPGVYTVRLTVNDGGLSSSATSTATVTEALSARVFSDGPATFVTGQSTPMTLHLESADASYRIEEITPWPMQLQASGSGTVEEIFSVEDATVTGDSDGNQKPELTFTFGPQELALLFGNAAPGSTVMTHLRGTFFGGGYFDATLAVHIGLPEAATGPLRISPNPFNPEALVVFATSKSGPVRAHLFDVHGRLVRTMVYGPLEAGRHVMTIDAKDDGGRVLASGIYFFRLNSPDGSVTRRVAIAK